MPGTFVSFVSDLVPYCRYKEIMMAKCWQVEPKDRPTFSELIEDMKEVVKELLGGDMAKIPEPAPRQLSIKEIRSDTQKLQVSKCSYGTEFI